MPLPPEMAQMQETVERYAREFGLDFTEIRYEMLDYRMINQVAAYDGFPSRYPHWRFGMEYERLSKSYAYGLHRIYEMVINTDPCYAYLLKSNNLVDQKLVMAHVCGHADFFKNNLWFAHTNRKMLDEIANHGSRIRRYIEKYGLETVETFLDACLSLDNLIDIHSPGIRRRPSAAELEEDDDEQAEIPRIQAKEYMDSFINPPEYLARQKRKADEEKARRKQFPEQPERDVLLFLMEHGPLENWQRDVLGIVREEAYYFAPQRQTKIMNEGWASYIHSYIMTQRAMSPDELIDYADHNAGTLAVHPGRLNPYKMGVELLRDIEDRWNRGAFGPEYEACESIEARRQWDRKLGLGRQKIFEVRRIFNDVGFIDTFLTEDFARDHKLFTFAYNEDTEQYEIASRNFQEVKRRLLFQLTNFGQPIIEVIDANFQNRGELYLVHRHEGIDLDVPYAEDTLRGLYYVWGRPVHIETEIEDRGHVVFSHDAHGGRHQRL
ncbi:MAG: SpoVR family protein [Chloroflexota bacterium]